MKTGKIPQNALRLLIMLMLSTAQYAVAAPREQSGGEALRKMQYMMQKLSAEKADLEKETLRLSEELKKTQAELDAAHNKLDQTEQAHSAAQQRNELLTERVREDSARITEQQADHRKQLGDARADIQLLRNAVQEREAWINDCHSKNEALYKVNSELLESYRKKGVWSAIKQQEPLTGIGSVQVEKMVQDYKFRLEDLRTIKFEAEPDGKQTAAGKR